MICNEKNGFGNFWKVYQSFQNWILIFQIVNFQKDCDKMKKGWQLLYILLNSILWNYKGYMDGTIHSNLSLIVYLDKSSILRRFSRFVITSPSFSWISASVVLLPPLSTAETWINSDLIDNGQVGKELKQKSRKITYQ